MDAAQADHLVDEDPAVIPLRQALEAVQGVSRWIEAMERELAETQALRDDADGCAANVA